MRNCSSEFLGRDRCKVYDLRHAWALRARETTTWSTALKAMAMGHSEAVHARRYLLEEQDDSPVVRAGEGSVPPAAEPAAAQPPMA